MMSLAASKRRITWMIALLFSMGMSAGGVTAAALVDESSPQKTAATDFAGGDEGGEVDCEQQPTHPDCEKSDPPK